MAVANTLPTTRGYIRSGSQDTLDSLLFADFATTYSISLKDLYRDSDGEQDLSRLRVVDIRYDDQKLNMADPETDWGHSTLPGPEQRIGDTALCRGMTTAGC